MNPMESFKKAYSKEYDIQGKKFLFRSLTTKEIDDIEKEVARKSVSLTDDSKVNTRKIETLMSTLVSVDGTPINKFDNIQAEVSKGGNEKELIRAEIGSWDDSFTNLLYLYYNKLVAEKDAQFKNELEYLMSEVK